MKQNRKGFTLAELLIVVAIIGVLVAIAIPIFTAQLERSRESTDLANARGMYAEVMAAAIGEDSAAAYNGTPIKKDNGNYEAVYSPLKQMQDGWQTNMTDISIGGVPSSDWIGLPGPNGSCTITYDPDPDDGGVTIRWNSSAGGGGSGDNPGDNPGDDSGSDPAAIATNTQTMVNIAEAVKALMATHGSNPNTIITITVNSDGIVNINIKGKKAYLTETEIRDVLAGYMTDGKVNLESGDNANCYVITVQNNPGHGNDGKKEVERF